MITRGTSPIDLADMGKVLSVDDQLCFARPFDISPDSTQVAFTWNATGNWEIHVVPIAGGTPRRLTSRPDNKYYPRWSPDGERIAYLRDADGSENFDIYVVPEGGGEPVALVQWPGVVERFFQWSPSGAQVAFESNKDGDFPVSVPHVDTGVLRCGTRNTVPRATAGAPASSAGGYLVMALDIPAQLGNNVGNGHRLARLYGEVPGDGAGSAVAQLWSWAVIFNMGRSGTGLL